MTCVFRRTRRYEAHIWHGKQQVYLGSFSDEPTAARAYDIIAIRLRGEAANFPRDLYESTMQHIMEVRHCKPGCMHELNDLDWNCT